MIGALEKTYTIAEYLALEETSNEKLEYYSGNIITMSGATARHNEIALKIGAALLYLL